MRVRVALFLAPVSVAAGLTLSACTIFGADDPTPAVPASPTATVEGTPTAEPTSAGRLPDAQDVVMGEAVPLSGELALIVTAGERIRRDASGVVVTEALFEPWLWGASHAVTYWNIHYLGPTLPPGMLLITACTTADGCGGVEVAPAAARSAVYRSRNGGVTWEADEEFDAVYQVASTVSFDRALLARLPRGTEHQASHFEWWPGGEIVEPPQGWNSDRLPQVLPGGAVAWWLIDGRLVTTGGVTLVDLREQTDGGAPRGIAVLPRLEGDRVAVTWEMTTADEPRGRWYWSIYEVVGSTFTHVSTYEAPSAMIPVAWLDPVRFLFNSTLDDVGRLPAVMDLSTGEAAPIDIGPGRELGRGWVVSYQQGPFAMINAGAGDCLNVRQDPQSGALTLGCLAHGMLVQRISPAQDGWMRIRTPAGTEGWASTQYLQVIPVD